MHGPASLDAPDRTARSARFVMTQQNAQPMATSRSERFSLDTNPEVSAGTSRNSEFVIEAWVVQ